MTRRFCVWGVRAQRVRGLRAKSNHARFACTSMKLVVRYGAAPRTTAAPRTPPHRSEHESRLCQVPLDSARCSNVRVPQAVSVTVALAQQNAGGNYPSEAANP